MYIGEVNGIAGTELCPGMAAGAFATPTFGGNGKLVLLVVGIGAAMLPLPPGAMNAGGATGVP
jgi:hypothetical protein